MTVDLRLLVPLLGCLSGIPASAQGQEPPAWFRQADKNGDGRLSRDEVRNPDDFAKADADGDGFVTLEEMRAWFAKNPRPQAGTPPAGAEPTQAAATPEDVERRPVTIWSHGVKMAGDLYLPKNRKPGEKLPAIAFCAGTGGTKKGLPTRLGPILARNGFICLGFDYRGWGESDSEILVTEKVSGPDAKGEVTVKGKPIRWQMNLMDQTFDIRCAIAFLAGEPDVDPNRIGLFGSSYGGGLVTLMAAIDPRVKCAAAQVSGLGLNSKAEQAAFALLSKQARGEIEPVPMETGKLGGKLERYVDMRRNPARSVGFGEKEEVVGRIRVPMIFVDAEKEELSDPKENGEKFASILKANGVPVEYHVIKGITHYGIYREGFEEATRLELAFFRKHLQGKAGAASSPAAPPAENPSVPSPPRKEEPQEPSKPSGAKPSAADPEAAFRFLDADRDGVLTEAEVGKLKDTAAAFRDNPKALSPFFARLDADGDGKVTPEEYRKGATPRPRPSAPPTAAAPPKPAAPPSAAQLAHFEKKIRPVLVAKCYECHSAASKKIKGGLALDTREGLRKGGDSGPAVVPGDPKASLLIAALRHEQDMAMPPKEKLSPEQIADFVTWIESGAADPRDGAATVSAPAVDAEKARTFWAFRRPLAPAVPKPDDEAWPLTDIDCFVRAAQERNGLKVVADADPHTLVRRLYIDLIGLPPTPEEIETFANEWRGSPQRALESAVDRLLASPRFGERWGRHWLDVARYAESSGKETSFSYPQAWRYRDYVIAAFNADVPFDRFVLEQIAGDLLPAPDDRRRAEQLVATGFLAVGPKSHIERNKKQFEMDLVDEQIDAVTQAFLGLTVACARCHDHKFDPIPQADYYAMAGIFRSTETFYGTIPLVQNNNPGALLTLPKDSGMEAGIPALSSAERRQLEQQVADLRAQRADLAKKREFGTSESVRIGILLGTLEGRLKAFEADGTPRMLAMGVRDRGAARDSELFVRGEIEKPGATVPRGFVSVLCATSTPAPLSGSGRIELARWIASPENPLTARVYVNRVWLNLFGRGLVTTPDNFGASGQAPSHPDLLDHLATTFVAERWSTKALIRRIVLSRVYRLSPAFVEANFAKDPDNVWLWRMSPRRLDAEAIRDAMLANAGRLDLTPPVGSVVAAGGEGYTGGVERGGQLAENRFNCRAVYLPAIRGRAFESLAEFDGVDGSVVTGQRSETTVPSQSLYLLNSPFVTGVAGAAALRLAKEAGTPAARVELAYRRIFGRAPTDGERSAALSFLGRYKEKAKHDGRAAGDPENEAWTAFCQSLWASGEFLVRR
jgi:acetyl esterase/lipase